DWILRIRVTHDPRRTRLAQRGNDALVGGEYRQRRVATADPLGGNEYVRHNIPVLNREPATRSTKAGHHLVSDKQHVVPIADLADPLKIAGRRRYRAHRRADDRLRNE